jgi:hypothetical protein
LAYKGYVTARWGAQMLGAMDKIKSEAATKTTYPFFVIYGTDDIATNMAGGEYLIQNAKNSKYGHHHQLACRVSCCVLCVACACACAVLTCVHRDKQAKYFDNWKHALLQEPSRQLLFADLVEWVKSRI